MNEVNASDHVLLLLDAALRRLAVELRTAQGDAMARLGLRASHLRLLSMLPPEGLRLTDLAERVGMSKQAAGEFCDALQQRGLLQSAGDPADRRVRFVRRTVAGEQLAADTLSAIVRLDGQLSDRLGAGRWADAKQVLREVAETDLPWPAPP